MLLIGKQKLESKQQLTHPDLLDLGVVGIVVVGLHVVVVGRMVIVEYTVVA